MADKQKKQEEQESRVLNDAQGKGVPDVQPSPHIDVDDGAEEDDKEKGTVTLFGRTFAKKKVVMAGLGGLLALALVGGVAYAASTQPQKADPAPVVSQAEGTEESKVELSLSVGVRAEGWDTETSTPVIVHVVNEAEGIDFYHAYDANEPERLSVEAEEGYEVSFISPVNADGSIYKVPDAAQVDAREVDDDGELPFTFERIAAEDVTTEELNELAASVTAAVKSGDETLTGENGVKVAELVAENIKANANADEEAVEEESQAAESSASSGESAAKTEGKTQASDSGSDGSTGNKGGSASAGSGSSGNGGSSSSGNSGSGSGSNSQSHTHSWVAQTKTVHHDAVYQTVHHEAQYQTVHHDAVTEYRSICNNCGADITGNTSAHMKESLLNGGNCGSYSTKAVVTQEAYDEQVLVQAAYDEQVLVNAAWDETVTTGYKCSCGATK